MSIFTELINILPVEVDLLSGLSNLISGDEILQRTFKKLQTLQKLETGDNEQKQKQVVRDSLEMLNVLIDFLHENLHMGEWHAIDIKLRKSYAVASLFKVLLLIYDETNPETLEESSYILDMAIMLGDRLVLKTNEAEIEVLQKAASIISEHLTRECELNKRLSIPVSYDPNCRCDIKKLDCPSIEQFIEKHYIQKLPVLMSNSINHWPAMDRWIDPNYLLKKAGSRTVPIEVGSKYTEDNWSQSLVKFSEFLSHCLDLTETVNDIAYLAQHDLFDQITELRDDICIPDYIGGVSDEEPRIKAWLGPKGTVSPLHTDPTHNLLCQVFGSKKIVLAAPEDTNYLYPHDHFILNNTSRIDVEQIDLNEFPLVEKAKFYELTLQRGDMLYIPPKWWHFVRALTPSFSVSFWFE